MGESLDTMTEFWNDERDRWKERRDKRLAKASPEGWHQYTEYHWSRLVKGERLDYWPSSGKWKYKGEYHQGGIKEFLQKHSI